MMKMSGKKRSERDPEPPQDKEDVSDAPAASDLKVQRTDAPRLRWKPLTSITVANRSKSRSQIINSIQTTFSGIAGFDAYDMKGDQSATTTVNIGGTKTYETKLQMHSEMCAIQATPVLHRLRKGMVRRQVSAADFTTAQPHCAYCTYFLKLLDLPLTKPSRGLFNQAGNCKYPLPSALKYDQGFIGRSCGFGIVRKPYVADLAAMINDIYVETGEADWSEIAGRRQVLDDLWFQVFGCLNTACGG